MLVIKVGLGESAFNVCSTGTLGPVGAQFGPSCEQWCFHAAMGHGRIWALLGNMGHGAPWGYGGLWATWAQVAPFGPMGCYGPFYGPSTYKQQ